MKVFVINEEQIKHYALMILALIIVVFLLGYFAGVKLSAPEKNLSLIEESDSKIIDSNAIITAKNDKETKTVEKAIKTQPEKIQKKKVEKKVEKKKPKIKKTEKKVVTPKATTKNRVKEKVAPIKSVPKKIIAEKNKPLKTKPIATKTKEVKPTKSNSVVKKSQNLVNSNSTEEGASAEKTYSIQAGMFASRLNADSFIKKLAEKEFNAYVSDFESSSGNIKYNVRVGKFTQREQARLRLLEFQKLFSSPAYVVISQ